MLIKYIFLDQVEHHFPKKWVFKVGNHIRDLTKTLGGYLKAEATLILVSFYNFFNRIIYTEICKV